MLESLPIFFLFFFFFQLLLFLIALNLGDSCFRDALFGMDVAGN